MLAASPRRGGERLGEDRGGALVDEEAAGRGAGRGRVAESRERGPTPRNPASTVS